MNKVYKLFDVRPYNIHSLGTDANGIALYTYELDKVNVPTVVGSKFYAYDNLDAARRHNRDTGYRFQVWECETSSYTMENKYMPYKLFFCGKSCGSKYQFSKIPIDFDKDDNVIDIYYE